MKIEKDTAVTLRYKVADANGKLLEQSSEPMVYLHGGYDNTFPKLEAALEGKMPGFQTTLDLQPQDAFGLRDEGLVQTIPKTQFPPGVKVGGQQGRQGHAGRQSPDGRQGLAAERHRDGSSRRHRGRDYTSPCAWRAWAPPLSRINGA